MAFKDENGRITIDEVAAQKDVRNLLKSKENLENVSAKLKEILAVAMEFSGKTGTVIGETAQQLEKEVLAAIARVDETVNTIQVTVKTYQTIDSNLKDLITGTK